MRNDEGHQVYFKARDIFREYLGDKSCCSIPDVEERIEKAITEGLPKKKCKKKRWSSAFTCWTGTALPNFIHPNVTRRKSQIVGNR